MRGTATIAYTQTEVNQHAVDCLVRTLNGYGVLTSMRLRELSGGEHWPGRFQFQDALRQAVAQGRLYRLGDDLYELGPKERDRHAA